MARVPFQQNLNVDLQAGSEVQFGATSVEPMRDVVTDDIERSAKALQQTGQIAQKLDDELNDAEAKKLPKKVKIKQLLMTLMLTMKVF